MKGSRLTHLTVICARPDEQDEAIGPPISTVLSAVNRFSDHIHFVGRFPAKDIDPLLVGRIVVIGEEHQLAAVVVRMLRRGLLGGPDTGPPEAPTPVGYIALQRNEFSTRWQLPVGVDAVEFAFTGTAQPIPLVRDDAGGVLLSHGEVENPVATAYLDENQILTGSASRLVVRPDPERGLSVTVERRRALRLPPKREVHLGRALSIGFAEPTVVVSDGIPRARPLPRWTWYAHPEPLYLARP